MTYIGDIHNLKKERSSGSGLKKDYWIEPKKIIEKAKDVEDTKISNGHIPLTPTGNKDKKSIGWSKFRIRG